MGGSRRKGSRQARAGGEGRKRTRGPAEGEGWGDGGRSGGSGAGGRAVLATVERLMVRSNLVWSLGRRLYEKGQPQAARLFRPKRSRLRERGSFEEILEIPMLEVDEKGPWFFQSVEAEDVSHKGYIQIPWLQ